MVGNDVVDLGDREARPLHPRFDARVLSGEERRALGRSRAPTQLRWMLWAAKEAAYKLFVKREPDTVFSPVRFAVDLDPDGVGEVVHAGRRRPVRVVCRGDAVHAVCSDGCEDRLICAVEATSAGDLSRAVRDLAARVLSERLGVARGEVRFGRRGRIPTVDVGSLAGPIDLSLSHHGRYVAVACEAGEATR